MWRRQRRRDGHPGDRQDGPESAGSSGDPAVVDLRDGGDADGGAHDDPFAGLDAGDPIGPVVVTVSDEANRRYWEWAGADHPVLHTGALYPPIAANLTILALQEVCARPVLQTAQWLRCHRREQAGTALAVHGHVIRRYVKREREYLDVVAVVTPEGVPDDPIWTSVASFTPARAPVGARARTGTAR